MQIDLKTEEELFVFSAQVARALKPGMVVYLKGQLGAGKTTFTRGILREFGFHDKVKSPTYTLVEHYELHHQTIYHFDLYRLKSPRELDQIGIHEYFTPNSICIIEWPENGHPVLPKPDLTCFIDFLPQGRSIKLEANTTTGKSVLEKLAQNPSEEIKHD